MTQEAQSQDREASSLPAWKKQCLRPIAEVVGWVSTVQHPGPLVERVTCEQPAWSLRSLSHKDWFVHSWRDSERDAAGTDAGPPAGLQPAPAPPTGLPLCALCSLLGNAPPAGGSQVGSWGRQSRGPRGGVSDLQMSPPPPWGRGAQCPFCRSRGEGAWRTGNAPSWPGGDPRGQFVQSLSEVPGRSSLTQAA